MGLGGNSRKPFDFLRSINDIAFVFDNNFCQSYSEINIAIDFSVVLHSIVNEKTFEYNAEELPYLLSSELPRKAANYLKFLFTAVHLDTHDVNIWIVGDNGYPPAKEIEHRRRYRTKQNYIYRDIFGCIGNRQDFCKHFIDNVVADILHNHTLLDRSVSKKLLIHNYIDLVGEGEYNCVSLLSHYMRYKKQQQINTCRSLNAIVSIDSDLLLYLLLQTVYENDSKYFILNSKRIELDNDIAQRFIYDIHQFSASITKLTTNSFPLLNESYRFENVNVTAQTILLVDVKIYVFALLLLHGNDFLPCILNYSISFSEIHEFIIRFLAIAFRNKNRKQCSVSFEMFKEILTASMSMNIIKQTARMKDTRSKKEQLEALEQWYEYVVFVMEYMTDSFRLNLEVASPFFRKEPFQHYFFFQSCFNRRKWKNLLAI